MHGSPDDWFVCFSRFPGGADFFLRSRAKKKCQKELRPKPRETLQIYMIECIYVYIHGSSSGNGSVREFAPPKGARWTYYGQKLQVHRDIGYDTVLGNNPKVLPVDTYIYI